MNKNLITACWICCLSAGLHSQTTKYFIKFKDKIGTPYTVTNPGAFLSSQAVSHRSFYNISIDVTDLPVTPSYITQVENIPHVKVIYPIKWLNGVVVYIDTLQSSALNAINALSFVGGSTPTNRYKLNVPESVFPPVGVSQSGFRAASTASYDMGGSNGQNQQIDVICLHNKGFRGQGMTIAVLDVGFSHVDINPVFDSLRNRNGILGTRDFVSGGTSVYEDPSHGAEVLSCMAAIQSGTIMGSAPLANYWLLRTEDQNSETPTEEYNWVRGAEFADSVGADILTTSLGYTTFDDSTESNKYATLNGRTAPMSIAATMAARKGLFVLNAAGNEGGNSWQYIAVPGDADSICTVGAVDYLGVVAGFSSTGPTADGRIKPDLVATGANAWLADDSGVSFPGSGTSFATPILAGGVACFWQCHRWINNMAVLNILKASASNSASPNNSIGWGIPDLCAASPVGLVTLSKPQSNFKVAPNPFQNAVTVSLSESEASVFSIELVDVLGNAFVSLDNPVMGNSGVTLSTVSLPEGVYFIKMHTSKGILSKKIVKQ